MKIILIIILNTNSINYTNKLIVFCQQSYNKMQQTIQKITLKQIITLRLAHDLTLGSVTKFTSLKNRKSDVPFLSSLLIGSLSYYLSNAA